MGDFTRKLKPMMTALSPILRRLALPLQALILGAVAFFLISRLSAYSWHDILHSLPRTGWFYGFFACLYVTPPLIDFLLYRGLLGIDARSLPVFFYKRSCNEAFFDYSGEAFFYVWAKRRAELAGQMIFDSIKNVNILSALSSNIMTLGILALAATGHVAGIATLYDEVGFKTILLIAVVIIGLVAIVVGTRARIHGLTLRQGAIICTVHCGRILAVMMLQVAMWSSLMPDVPLRVWVIFLGAQMVLGRAPFIPNRDLVFAGLAIGLAPHVLSAQLSVLGMFMTAATLTLVCHLMVCLLFAIAGGTAAWRGRPAAGQVSLVGQ